MSWIPNSFGWIEACKRFNTMILSAQVRWEVLSISCLPYWYCNCITFACNVFPSLFPSLNVSPRPFRSGLYQCYVFLPGRRDHRLQTRSSEHVGIILKLLCLHLCCCALIAFFAGYFLLSIDLKVVNSGRVTGLNLNVMLKKMPKNRKSAQMLKCI